LRALKPGPDPGDRSGRPPRKTPSMCWTSPGGGRAGRADCPRRDRRPRLGGRSRGRGDLGHCPNV